MKLIYSGPKQTRTVEYPIPMLAKSMKEGQIKFVRGQAVECPDGVAEQLMAMAPDYFKPVATATLLNQQKG